MTTQPDALPNTRKIDAKEARECLSRFVASHFRDGRETARFSIPANVNRDDDLLLGQFIDDAAATAHALAASRAECERLRVALEEIIKAWDHKTGDYYVDNYLSDVEIDAARAALAAQGGGT